METLALYMNANTLEMALPWEKGKYPLNDSKCRKIFEDAVKRAGITKEVPVHSLVIVFLRTYREAA